jgi:hypothetical protein
MANEDKKGMTPREFAGNCNRAKEILVPVVFGDHEEAVEWLAVKKSDAKDRILERAKELELETIDATFDEEDGCLYIDPDDEESEDELENEEEKV